MIAEKSVVAEIVKTKVHMINNFPIKVKLYENRKEKKEVDRSNAIYVGNLPDTATEEKLTDLFSPYGNIIDVKLFKGRTGKFPNYAFVKFSSEKECNYAVCSNLVFKIDGVELVKNYAEKDRKEVLVKEVKEVKSSKGSRRTKSADRKYLSSDFVGPYKIKPTIPECYMYSPI